MTKIDTSSAAVERLVEYIEHGDESAVAPETAATLKALARERDLAVAHDRQPYPTAWAYEQVCKERDALSVEVVRWFKYVDPFDIYSEDAPHYDTRAAILGKETQ
jgi:hypothetical protein